MPHVLSDASHAPLAHTALAFCALQAPPCAGSFGIAVPFASLFVHEWSALQNCVPRQSPSVQQPLPLFGMHASEAEPHAPDSQICAALLLLHVPPRSSFAVQARVVPLQYWFDAQSVSALHPQVPVVAHTPVRQTVAAFVASQVPLPIA
jgi:hypothetical protein